jgi:hypothetical protein
MSSGKIGQILSGSLNLSKISRPPGRVDSVAPHRRKETNDSISEPARNRADFRFSFFRFRFRHLPHILNLPPQCAAKR